MTTRKDFVRIAATVANIRNVVRRRQEALAWSKRLIVVNPRFDRKRFIAACNVK
jgi:hypothetical protein